MADVQLDQVSEMVGHDAPCVVLHEASFVDPVSGGTIQQVTTPPPVLV